LAKRKNKCPRGHEMALTRKTHPNGDTYCYECKRVRTRQSRKNNPERTSKYNWRSKIKAAYGLTEDDYDSLFKLQNGKCAICNTSLEYRSRSTHIDHNHSTLEIRGLLCHHCNTAIGLMKEDIVVMNNAIRYLSEAGMSKKKKK